jgi:hypothetical protein
MKVKVLVAAGAMALVVLAGCSSDDSSSDSSSSTTTTLDKQAACAARTDLKQSVTALTDPSLRSSGKAAIESALATVKTNLDAVSSTTGAPQAQVDDVKSAISDLETTLSKVGNGGNEIWNQSALRSRRLGRQARRWTRP